MPAAGLTFCHGVLRCTSKQCLTFAQAKIKHEQYYREPCAWIALAKQCFSGSNNSKHVIPVQIKNCLVELINHLLSTDRPE